MSVFSAILRLCLVLQCSVGRRVWPVACRRVVALRALLQLCQTRPQMRQTILSCPLTDTRLNKYVFIQSLTNAFNGLFAPYDTSNPFYFFLEIHLNLDVNSFSRLSSLVTMSSCRALEVAPTLTTVTLWTPCPQSSLQTTTRSQRPSIWTNGQIIYLRHESPFKNELLQLMKHFMTYIQPTKNYFDDKNSPLYSLKTKFSLWYNRICLHISNLSKEYYLYVIRPVLKGKFTSKRIEILKLCTTKYLV